MLHINKRFLGLLLLNVSLCALLTAGHVSAQTTTKPPINYEANQASFNRIRQIATLTGDVVITQDGQTLKADKVTYDRINDVMLATGNVILTDKNGQVTTTDNFELSDQMKKGLANQIMSVMEDGGRVRAAYGTRQNGNTYTMEKARYTACAPCENDPDASNPPWQIHADNVIIDETTKKATYHNAWFDVFGVPVLYTPWFQHSYQKPWQESGLLSPQFGWNSELGAFLQQRYYFGLAPDRDATVGVLTSTNQAPVLLSEYRRRYTAGDIKVNASGTRSSRFDTVAQQIVSTKDEWRGHLFANGRFDLNEHWRTGANLELASDPQYLRQYRITSKDVLDNRIYAERFSGRDYVLARAQLFQDLRTDAAKIEQPGILPRVSWSMLGDPGQTLGGRWSLDSDFLSLFREGSGQDVYRLSSKLGWERRDVLPLGALLTTNAEIRGDLYQTEDRLAAANDPNEPNTKQNARAFPTFQATLSYPLQKRMEKSALRIEPLVTVVATPNVNNSNDIPNEDSEDVQIDTGNVLSANRFSGYDRIEDRAHVAYGLKSGYYGDNGNQATTFIGQSQRIGNNTDNPFPTGSGLENTKSDYVGEVTVLFDDATKLLSYKTQVNGDTLSSSRHEVYGGATFGPLNINTTYLYARGTPGNASAPSREQTTLDASYRVTEKWTARAGVNYNLSQEDRGLRRVITGIDYNHECYNFSFTADREVARKTSGADQLTVMFRVGFKNLGEFSSGPLEASVNSDTTQ